MLCPPGGGDFQRALDVLLAAHVGEVDGGGGEALRVRGIGGGEAGQGSIAGGGLDEGPEGGEADDFDGVDQGGFGRVDVGEDESGEVGGAQGGGDGEDAGDVAEVAVEGQFPEEDGALGDGGGDLPGGHEDADGDGEVVAGAFFAQVGGGEVDGDALGGQGGAGVAQGGAHALARLRDGRVRQADDVEGGQPGGDVDFDGDDFAAEADDGAAGDAGKHEGMVGGRGGTGGGGVCRSGGGAEGLPLNGLRWQAAPNGFHGDLCAVGAVPFYEDAGEVLLDRGDGDVESRGDFAVGHALGEQGDHGDFPWRQFTSIHRFALTHLRADFTAAQHSSQIPVSLVPRRRCQWEWPDG